MTQAYIKRADAINTILEAMTNGETNTEEIFNTALRKAASRIETIPPEDVVPVVRCKDCIYMERNELGTSAYCCLHSEGRLTLMLRYCPDGKRKGDA